MNGLKTLKVSVLFTFSSGTKSVVQTHVDFKVRVGGDNAVSTC